MGGTGIGSAWLTLFRIGNTLTGVMGVILGAIVALGEVPSGDYGVITVLQAASVLCFMASWNALNDIFDLDIDRVNRPDRPLPSGAIDLRTAKIATSLMMLTSLVCMFLAWFTVDSMGNEFSEWLPSLVIWLVALFLLANYEFPSSLRLKDRGLPGNIAISISVGLVVVFGAAGVLQPYNQRAWALFFVGVFYNTSREVVKDIEDMDGDEGRNTLAMRVGADSARTVSWVISLAALAAVIMPFALEIFPPLHVVFTIPAVISLMMVKSKLLMGEDNAASALLKRSMILCLAAFLGSSLLG
jgi:geranylgeranylglycerol-phosphate geranylgeranyltransferase|tara:strand:- start:781 stop:1680 length:900 start_codon:yes stop_codon:yes gene_type:complete